MSLNAIRELIGELRQNPTSDSYFENYSHLLRLLTRASHCLLLLIDREGGSPRLLAADPAPSEWLMSQSQEVINRHRQQLLLEEGAATYRCSDPQGQMRIIVAQRLNFDPGVLAIFDVPARESSSLNELLLRVELVADLAVAVGTGAGQEIATRGDSGKVGGSQGELLDALELMAEIMSQDHYKSAVVMLVNGLGGYLGSPLVVLGWSIRNYIRIEGISYVSRFGDKVEQTRLLESACEEAYDQGESLSYPDQSDSDLVLLAHRQLHQEMGARRVITTPLWSLQGRCQAVLLVAEEDVPISEARLSAIQIGMQLLIPWLEQRRKSDRWWGARLFGWLGRRLGQLLGLENLWHKAGVLLLVAGMVYLFTASWPFRLEASGQLVTDQTRQFGAPFDGYIDQVYFSTGDEVDSGVLLAQMDIKDLLLQEAEIRAEIRRIHADTDKARAQNNLVDVEIAAARLAQSGASLERVLQQRKQAEIRTPFAGVVVDGERKDLLGAPVRKGDLLFRIARIEGLYGQLELPEYLIRYLQPNAVGELSLLAQPNQYIPFQVTSVVPMAQVRGQQGNHFVVKVQFDQQPEQWWRPGMSGMARIDAGERPLIWLWTYRLIDNLRMRFWW